MRLALDTNRYSDLMAGDLALADQVSSTEWIGVPFAVLAELRSGFALGKKSAENDRALTRFLNRPGVHVLWPTEATTRLYASIFRELRTKGRPVPANDLWIAATALENGAALATRDPHFREIPELLVVGPG